MNSDFQHATASTIRRNPHLFAGRLGEMVAAPSDGVARERDLHDEIIENCQQRGWLAFHGSMAHATKRTEGEPDFIVLAGDGRTLLVECKRKDGKLSPAQQGVVAHAKRLGHTIHIVRSIAEWTAVADAWRQQV